VRAAAIDAAQGLAAAMLAGTVRGELSAQVLGASVNLSATRGVFDSVANSTRAGPGGAGAVALPASVFEAQRASDMRDGVDVVLITYAVPVHADPSAQLIGGAAAARLESSTYSITLKSVAAGSVLAISGLATPIQIEIPLSASMPAGNGSDPAVGAFNCTADAQCDAFSTGAGVCGADGACACAFTYSGERCELRTLCRFWDEAASVWSTEGCVTLPTPAGGDTGTLYCACDHLTDFAGVSLPLSLAEVEADASFVKINTFGEDDLARTFDVTPELITQNPSIYVLVFLLVGGCVVCLLLGVLKDEVDARARRVEMARVRAQLKRLGRDEKKWARPPGRDVKAVGDMTREDAVAGFIEDSLDGMQLQLGVARERAARILQRGQLRRAARKEVAAAVSIVAREGGGDAESRAAARARVVAATARLGNVSDPAHSAHARVTGADRSERLITRAARAMMHGLRGEHSVLAVFFSREATLPRPVLVQVLFNLIMIEVGNWEAGACARARGRTARASDVAPTLRTCTTHRSRA
jgi:hypothetical protein